MFIASTKYILRVSYIDWCHMDPMTVNGLTVLLINIGGSSKEEITDYVTLSCKYLRLPL